jgi:hypothetical protein
MCKHVAAVERRAEREGWDFGAVAPPTKPTGDGQPVDTTRVVERAASAAAARANADLFGA